MRLFIQSLSGVSTQENPNIENPFSQIAAVQPWVENYSNSFTGMAMIGSRIYVTYRAGVDHVTYDGVIMAQYSDDDGETWSNSVEIYNTDQLLIDFPEYISADPLATGDARDPRLMTSEDGQYLYMFIFSRIGTSSVQQGVQSESIRFPIVNGVPDFDNGVNAYIDPVGETAFGGGFLEVDGKIYITTYSFNPDFTRNYIWESTNNGSSWQNVGIVLDEEVDPDYGCNESTLLYNGSTMYIIGRNKGSVSTGPQYQSYSKSADFGRTWTGTTRLLGYRADGLNARMLDNNRAVVTGRRNIVNDTALYVINLDDFTIETDWFIVSNRFEGTDRGYSNILNYRNKWFIVWYEGPPQYTGAFFSDTGVYFRQLNYDPDTYTFSYGND